MAKKNPQQVAAKWARNLAQATESIRNGVNAVTTSPMEKAAAQQQAYVDGVMRAAQSGKWARGLRRKTLEDWKQAMLNKGLNRIGQGATSAQPDVEKFQARWLQHMDALQSKLSSMPRGSPEQNIERLLTAVRHNMDFKYQ